MKIDWLQIALWVNLTAILVAVITAGIIVWNNAGSKNLALSVAAFVGVTVAFLIQLPFELNRSVSNETIGFEYTIDRAQPVIRQWIYDSAQSGWRLIAEVEASNWLAKTRPEAFAQLADRDKMGLDLSIYSLPSFLTHEEYDWQLQRKSYGRFQTAQSMSKLEDCSSYTDSDIEQQLTRAGSMFAGAPVKILLGKLCLPPKTRLEISQDTLSLTNSFCQLIFRAEHPAHMILNVHPTERHYVDLGNGEPRY
jgi:hypothetical protein